MSPFALRRLRAVRPIIYQQHNKTYVIDFSAWAEVRTANEPQGISPLGVTKLLFFESHKECETDGPENRTPYYKQNEQLKKADSEH